MLKNVRTLGFLTAALCALTASAAFAQDEDGKTLFTKNCSTCHQVSGMGIPHYYPPLLGSPVLTGDADKAILVVLKGRDGMPDWAPILKDDQIAKILTYARSSWGNDAPPIDAAKVGEMRKTISSSSFNIGN